MINTFLDSLVGMGIDVTKHHFNNKIDERKLRAELTDFMKQQKRHFAICSHAEEYDFQGLMEYLTGNFISDLEKRIFSLNKKERRIANDSLVAYAIDKAGANTEKAKEQIKKITESALAIVRNFYRKKHSIEKYVLIADIVDAVTDGLSQESSKIIKANETQAESIHNELRALRNELPNKCVVSIDKINELSAEGDFEKIAREIKNGIDAASKSHPLYPYYVFQMNENKLISTPKTLDAARLYPPKFKISGRVKAGDNYLDPLNVDPIDYAYRHQLMLTIEADHVIKMLGDFKDPIQIEAKDMEGKAIYATPPQFPKAMPYSIKVGEMVYFDYVLIRTQEIQDDGVIVLGNKKQENMSIKFEIRINPAELTKPQFIFRADAETMNNHKWLNYIKFMMALKSGADIHIYSLDQRTDFISGFINDFEYKTGFASVEIEVDFYEKICAIEEYFGISLPIPEQITEDEYQDVLYVADLVQNKTVTHNWKELTLRGRINNQLRQGLRNMESGMIAFSYTADFDELFGINLGLKFRRTYNCGYIENLDKVKRLVDMIDNGDEIKLIIKPGEDNTCIDSLNETNVDL